MTSDLIAKRLMVDIFPNQDIDRDRQVAFIEIEAKVADVAITRGRVDHQVKIGRGTSASGGARSEYLYGTDLVAASAEDGRHDRLVMLRQCDCLIDPHA